MEHQQDPGDCEDDEEEARNPSQTEGIGEVETVAFHLHREDVKKEILIHDHGTF